MASNNYNSRVATLAREQQVRAKTVVDTLAQDSTSVGVSPPAPFQTKMAPTAPAASSGLQMLLRAQADRQRHTQEAAAKSLAKAREDAYTPPALAAPRTEGFSPMSGETSTGALQVQLAAMGLDPTTGQPPLAPTLNLAAPPIETAQAPIDPPLPVPPPQPPGPFPVGPDAVDLVAVENEDPTGLFPATRTKPVWEQNREGALSWLSEPAKATIAASPMASLWSAWKSTRDNANAAETVDPRENPQTPLQGESAEWGKLFQKVQSGAQMTEPEIEAWATRRKAISDTFHVPDRVDLLTPTNTRMKASLNLGTLRQSYLPMAHERIAKEHLDWNGDMIAEKAERQFNALVDAEIRGGTLRGIPSTKVLGGFTSDVAEAVASFRQKEWGRLAEPFYRLVTGVGFSPETADMLVRTFIGIPYSSSYGAVLTLAEYMASLAASATPLVRGHYAGDVAATAMTVEGPIGWAFRASDPLNPLGAAIKTGKSFGAPESIQYLQEGGTLFEAFPELFGYYANYAANPLLHAMYSVTGGLPEVVRQPLRAMTANILLGPTSIPGALGILTDDVEAPPPRAQDLVMSQTVLGGLIAAPIILTTPDALSPLIAGGLRGLRSGWRAGLEGTEFGRSLAKKIAPFLNDDPGIGIVDDMYAEVKARLDAGETITPGEVAAYRQRLESIPGEGHAVSVAHAHEFLRQAQKVGADARPKITPERAIADVTSRTRSLAADLDLRETAAAEADEALQVALDEAKKMVAKPARPQRAKYSQGSRLWVNSAGVAYEIPKPIVDAASKIVADATVGALPINKGIRLKGIARAMGIADSNDISVRELIDAIGGRLAEMSKAPTSRLLSAAEETAAIRMLRQAPADFAAKTANDAAIQQLVRLKGIEVDTPGKARAALKSLILENVGVVPTGMPREVEAAYRGKDVVFLTTDQAKGTYRALDPWFVEQAKVYVKATLTGTPPPPGPSLREILTHFGIRGDISQGFEKLRVAVTENLLENPGEKLTAALQLSREISMLEAMRKAKLDQARNLHPKGHMAPSTDEAFDTAQKALSDAEAERDASRVAWSEALPQMLNEVDGIWHLLGIGRTIAAADAAWDHVFLLATAATPPTKSAFSHAVSFAIEASVKSQVQPLDDAAKALEATLLRHRELILGKDLEQTIVQALSGRAEAEVKAAAFKTKRARTKNLAAIPRGIPEPIQQFAASLRVAAVKAGEEVTRWGKALVTLDELPRTGTTAEANAAILARYRDTYILLKTEALHQQRSQEALADILEDIFAFGGEKTAVTGLKRYRAAAKALVAERKELQAGKSAIDSAIAAEKTRFREQLAPTKRALIAQFQVRLRSVKSESAYEAAGHMTDRVVASVGARRIQETLSTLSERRAELFQGHNKTFNDVLKALSRQEAAYAALDKARKARILLEDTPKIFLRALKGVRDSRLFYQDFFRNRAQSDVVGGAIQRYGKGYVLDPRALVQGLAMRYPRRTIREYFDREGRGGLLERLFAYEGKSTTPVPLSAKAYADLTAEAKRFYDFADIAIRQDPRLLRGVAARLAAEDQFIAHPTSGLRKVLNFFKAANDPDTQNLGQVATRVHTYTKAGLARMGLRKEESYSIMREYGTNYVPYLDQYMTSIEGVEYHIGGKLFTGPGRGARIGNMLTTRPGTVHTLGNRNDVSLWIKFRTFARANMDLADELGLLDAIARAYLPDTGITHHAPDVLESIKNQVRAVLEAKPDMEYQDFLGDEFGLRAIVRKATGLEQSARLHRSKGIGVEAMIYGATLGEYIDDIGRMFRHTVDPKTVDDLNRLMVTRAVDEAATVKRLRASGGERAVYEFYKKQGSLGLQGIADLESAMKGLNAWGKAATSTKITVQDPYTAEMIEKAIQFVRVSAESGDTILPVHLMREIVGPMIIKDPDKFASAHFGVAADNAWRQAWNFVRMNLMYGTVMPRYRYGVGNSIGDFGSAWAVVNPVTAGRVALTNLPTQIPVVGLALQKWMGGGAGGRLRLPPGVVAITNQALQTILSGRDVEIDLGKGGVHRARDLIRILIQEGALETSISAEFAGSINKVAETRLSGGLGMLATATEVLKSRAAQIAEYQKEIQKRQRSLLLLDLLSQGKTPTEAGKLTRESYLDFTHGLTRWETNKLAAKLGLFYRWQRLAATQSLRILLEPFIDEHYLFKLREGTAKFPRLVDQFNIATQVPQVVRDMMSDDDAVDQQVAESGRRLYHPANVFGRFLGGLPLTRAERMSANLTQGRQVDTLRMLYTPLTPTESTRLLLEIPLTIAHIVDSTLSDRPMDPRTFDVLAESAFEVLSSPMVEIAAGNDRMGYPWRLKPFELEVYSRLPGIRGMISYDEIGAAVLPGGVVWGVRTFFSNFALGSLPDVYDGLFQQPAARSTFQKLMYALSHAAGLPKQYYANTESEIARWQRDAASGIGAGVQVEEAFRRPGPRGVESITPTGYPPPG